VRITTFTSGFCFGAKATNSDEDVAVGIESKEVAEGLHGNNGAGGGGIYRYRLLKKKLQEFPDAASVPSLPFTRGRMPSRATACS
jgi:hypothetical protein